MQVEKLRTLIRESIQEYIKEIDQAANEAAVDASITKCEEAIQLRQERLNKINENDDLKEMVDETKVKNIQNEIKILEKAKKKYAAQKAKMQAKKDKKANPEKEVTTDAPIDEADVTAEMNMSDDKQEEALNESFLRMQKLAGVITETQYRQKKSLIENEITNSSVVQNLEKKAFNFFNQPKVAALLKKELDKLSPEEKAELTKMTMQEGEGNDFSSFKSAVEKGIDTVSLNEDAHDTLRTMSGYKPGQEATALDKMAGKVLTNLGVANIMSMGFLPALSAMALDYFGGTDVVNTVSQVVGDGGAAAALSVVAGLVGGGILWKLGKIMQNEKTTDDTPLFN